MRKFIELDTEQDFEELSEILDKIKDAHAIATLKQVIVKPDGEMTFADMQEHVVEGHTKVNINGEYCYLAFTSSNGANRRIANLWNAVLARGTQRYKKGESNDYILEITICRSDEGTGMAWLITAVQPIMISTDSGSEMTLVFSLANMYCSKDVVDEYEIAYEVETQSTVDSYDEYENSEDFDDVEEIDDEEYEENDDVLNTDDFLDV